MSYNGQRAGGHKRLFYAFYPVHIYILYALSWGSISAELRWYPWPIFWVVDDDGISAPC